MKLNLPCGRRLHLIDIENLAGSGRPTGGQIVACYRRYADLVKPVRGDLCVVACNHGAGVEVAFNWPGARYLWRSGRDGADLALLDVLEAESVPDRFDAVVLASGDRLFAEAIAGLAQCGVHVTVVANETALSRRLRIAAAAVILFGMDRVGGTTPPAAAIWEAA